MNLPRLARSHSRATRIRLPITIHGIGLGVHKPSIPLPGKERRARARRKSRGEAWAARQRSPRNWPRSARAAGSPRRASMKELHPGGVLLPRTNSRNRIVTVSTRMPCIHAKFLYGFKSIQGQRFWRGGHGRFERACERGLSRLARDQPVGQGDPPLAASPERSTGDIPGSRAGGECTGTRCLRREEVEGPLVARGQRAEVEAREGPAAVAQLLVIPRDVDRLHAGGQPVDARANLPAERLGVIEGIEQVAADEEVIGLLPRGDGGDLSQALRSSLPSFLAATAT